ncbi:MAG: glutathione S-transferase family protein [Myxococcota bacterium]
MTLQLYAHPFSSYCQKVLIALYENATPFEMTVVGDRKVADELTLIWPFKLYPVLVDEGRTVVESSIIIEHLGLEHPGPVRLLPADPKAALEVRMMDRFFDTYVMTPQGRIVANALRAPDDRDPIGDDKARAMLETAYAWLEGRLAGRTWAAGETFSLADCAAGPSLFYADWTHPIPESCPTLRAYRARLLGRPSFARCVEEARPFRPYFPLGAPDRD